MPDVMKTVGRYEILNELGRGGMAKVYLARQTDLDRFVALKELGAFHQDDEAFAQRFLRESRVAGSLSHPNIVTVHDFFSHEGTPYIAMEYVERGSLRPWVGKMTLAQIGGVLEGLLAGLGHAEQHDIVHRDLKPENVMVTSEGRVKIADFGIAKARNKMQTGAFLTATGTTVGTPTYMAPEQAMAQEVGPWTDMYSVGVMAFEMFVGRVPFHDSDAPMAILLRHVNEDIPLAHTQNPNVPVQISNWIARMLMKDVAQRTPNAAAVWDEFEGILIELLGARWRRDARLLGEPGSAGGSVDTPMPGSKPLTPAPFGATGGPTTESTGWGTGNTPPPTAGVAGPATPPPGPGVTPGPDTLEQHFNQPSAPNTPPSQMQVEPTDFITGAAPSAGGAAPPYPGHPPAPQHPGYGGQVPPTGDYAATMMPSSLPDAGAVAQTPPAKVKTKQRSLVPVIAIGAIVAAIGGFGISKAVGGGGSEEAANAGRPSTPFSGGPVALQVPAGWAKASSVPVIGGLTDGDGALKDAVAVAPAGRADGEGVLIGAVRNPNLASLLAPGFERTLGGSPSARNAVDLGEANAYKYTGLRSQGFDREIAIYAIPTGTGAMQIVCFAPSISAFGADCEAIALTAKLSGAEPATLGPNPDHAKDYQAIFDRLNDKVAAGIRKLGSAKTPKAQGKEARTVAAAYTAASKNLSRLKIDEYVDQKLVKDLNAAFKKAGKGFSDLSKAANAKSKSRYSKAQRAIASADDDIQDALAQFKTAGYKVGA